MLIQLTNNLYIVQNTPIFNLFINTNKNSLIITASLEPQINNSSAN